MTQKQQYKTYQVQRLVGNIDLVLKRCDIRQLSTPTYKFITLHMGFIAHYDLHGFREHYADLRTFCWKLQTSEYSSDENHTLTLANRYEADPFYRGQYGRAYVRSIALTIRGIVAVVRRLEPGVTELFDRFEKAQRLTGAIEKLEAYGITCPAQLKAELEAVSSPNGR